MKVIINNQEIALFNGARVCDAVLAYSEKAYKLLKEEKIFVTDSFGNLIAADGSLSEGQVIIIKKKEDL